MMIRLVIILHVTVSLTVLLRSACTQETTLTPKEAIQHSKPVTTDGGDNFRHLVQNNDIFVDKSLLIENVMTSDDESILLTCPSKWGKSVNLHMIKNFLEIEVDPVTGKHIIPSRNQALFKTGEITLKNDTMKKLKKPLLISTRKNFFQQHQGKYPVIYLSMKGLNSFTYIEAIHSLNEILENALKQHKYVINHLEKVSKNTSASPADAAQAECLLYDFTNILNKQAATETLIKSIKDLSEKLHEIHGKKVIVLLDDYDSHFNEIINGNTSAGDEQDITRVFSSFVYYTFKLNMHLEKGIIASASNAIKIFNKNLDITEYTIFSNHSLNFCGFDNHEVDQLFDEFALSQHLRQDAPLWYNGYFSHSHPNTYRPQAIVQLIKNKKINNYLTSNANGSFVQSIIRSSDVLRNLLMSLLNGGTETFKLNDLALAFDERSLEILRKFNQPNEVSMTYDIVDTSIAYLFSIGYLTMTTNSMKTAIIKLPNHEIRTDLAAKLMGYYQQKHNISSNVVDAAVSDFLKFANSQDEKSDHFRNSLHSLLKGLPLEAYIHKYGDNEITAIEQCQSLMRFVLHYLASRVALSSEYRLALVRERDKSNIILHTAERGVLIDVLVSFSEQLDLRAEINESRTAFREFPQINNIKLIGIHVRGAQALLDVISLNQVA